MIDYLIGSVAGRVATVLCVVVIGLPYVLRHNRLSRGLGLAQEHASPYLRRLWPHFWAGYGILVLSTVHAGTVMGGAKHFDSLGVYAATAAFFLLLFEASVGLSLKSDQVPIRRSLRRLHFWIMIAFAGALGMHLWLNA